MKLNCLKDSIERRLPSSLKFSLLSMISIRVMQKTENLKQDLLFLQL